MTTKENRLYQLSFLRERLCYLEHGVNNDIEDQIQYNVRAIKEILDDIAKNDK